MKIVSSLLFILLLVSCSGSKAPLELHVLSFNIRYDAAMDSLNSWQYRKEAAARVFMENNADVVGTQEVLVYQRNDLLDLLPGYSAIGVGREDGIEKGEFSAIFYKHDRFDAIDSGNFWLSETPDVAGSKGWDAVCERIATWAIFEDKASERQFFFLNTHLDHVGKVARQESIILLKEKINEINQGLPTIITGDFNANPESDIIQSLLEGDTFHDSRLIAETSFGPEGTFHNYGKIPMHKRQRIDFIFIDESVTAISNKTFSTKIDNIYVSDHAPVFAKLTIK